MFSHIAFSYQTADLGGSGTHHQLILGSGDGGQDVDTVSREVASVFGAIVDAMSPPGVHHMFSIMFIQKDQISFGETEEGGVDSSCEVTQSS